MNLLPGLWYKVKLDGDEHDERRACVNLRALADALPHGSGLDTDWSVSVARNGNVSLQTEYHGMDNGGMYNGWRPVHATLARVARTEYRALGGPCEGQYQVLARRGDIRLTVRARGDLGDYLYEYLDSTLREAGILRSTIEPTLVDRATAEDDSKGIIKS